MAEMVLEAGEKVYVIIRRGFADDLRRHFVGEVTAVADGCIRAEGFVFILDNVSGEYIRRPHKRTQLFSLYDSNLMVTVLPLAVDPAQVRYEVTEDRHLVVTDKVHFTLNVNEFGARF